MAIDTTEDERQWQSKLNETASTLMDRKLILDALDKLLRLKQERQTDLATAVALVGTCPDMCPEQERYFRIETNGVSAFEMDDSGAPDETRMVKEYRRSGADQKEPLPHELRPISVLQRTMNYLCLEIIDKDPLSIGVKVADWFDFIWSRTRSIRKDITQQHLINPESVDLIEKCARFHIYCAYYLCEEEVKDFDPKINEDHLHNCLQTLKEFYFELGTRSIYCPNEVEFRCYDVLLNLRNGETLSELKHYRKVIRDSADVRFAVKIYQAFHSKNHIKFFQMARKANFFMSCILNNYFNQFRIDLLNVMRRAYTVPKTGSVVPYPLEDIVQQFAFDDRNELASFCDKVELTYDSESILLRRNPPLYPTNIRRRSKVLVQAKLNTSPGRAILASECQLEILPVHTSFDAHNRLIVDRNALLSANYSTPQQEVAVKPKTALSVDWTESPNEPSADKDKQEEVGAKVTNAFQNFNGGTGFKFPSLFSTEAKPADKSTVFAKPNNSFSFVSQVEKLPTQKAAPSFGFFTTTIAAAADQLSDNKQPIMAEQAKQKEIETAWKQLQAKSNENRIKLEQNYLLQQFLTDYRDLISWIRDTKTIISSDKLAKDVAGAEALLERLEQKHQSEIEARKDAFAAFKVSGQSLIDKSISPQEVREKMSTLESEYESLIQLREERRILYEQCMDLQLFYRDTEQAESSMTKHETFLLNEDLGDSLDSVEALIKKHDDFENTLVTQSETVNNLNKFGEQLIEGQHYAKDDIQKRRHVLLQRRSQILEKSHKRRALLEAAYQLQQFERDCDEIKGLITEKLKTAIDENYRDPTNISSKLRNHQLFNQELKETRARIEEVNETGNELINKGHYAAEHIKSRVSEINELWTALNDSSEKKGAKLTEASSQQKFNRNVEDVELWLSEMESQIVSEDVGKDLTSVKNLLKKHALIESDIASHQDRIDDIARQADKFVEDGHFDADTIKAKQVALNERYNSLKTPLNRRKDRLNDALKVQQLFRDIEDEEAWIREKEPIAASTNRGGDLIGVQNLMKKHRAMIAEINNYEPQICIVTQLGENMIRMGHFASKEINRRLVCLNEQWSSLKEKSLRRKQDLEDSLQSQQYLEQLNYLKRTIYLEKKYFKLWLRKVRLRKRNFIRAQFPAAPANRLTPPPPSPSPPSRRRPARFVSSYTIIDPQIVNATASINRQLLKKLNYDYESTVERVKRKLEEREQRRSLVNSSSTTIVERDISFQSDSVHLEPTRKRTFSLSSPLPFGIPK